MTNKFSDAIAIYDQGVPRHSPASWRMVSEIEQDVFQQWPAILRHRLEMLLVADQNIIWN